MYSQKIRLFSLNLVLVMLFALIPVQAADIVIDDDGPLYTVVLDGNGGTYGDEGQETLSISYGNSPLYLEDYIFTKAGCTLLGWRESADENATTLDYTRFDSIYGGSTGEDTRTLYAVWGKGENCALYNQYIEGASQLGGYWVLNSEALPTMSTDSFVGWYDHLRGFYTSGEAAEAGEVYKSIFSYPAQNVYPIILNGNGGVDEKGNGVVFGGMTNDWFDWNLDNSFSRDDYILNGWVASPTSETLVPVNYHSVTFTDFTPNDGMVTLYAYWSPAYQLINDAKLVINGDEMNELLNMTSSASGTGWRFSASASSLRIYNPYGESECYSFGKFAFDKAVGIQINGAVSVDTIESNGRLGIYGDESANLQIHTHDIPAIQASHLELSSDSALSTDEGVCINTACLCLDSPNITIVGNPAVRADAQIICHNRGIGYTISEDRTTLTTYAIGQEVTLNGNGGTLDGAGTVTKSYTVNAPLDLSQYAFIRDGYVLVGWATDAEGTKLATDATGHLKYSNVNTLYAVWLKVPEDSAYAIFNASIPGAFSQHRPENGGWAYSCVKIGTDFTIPKISDDAAVPAVLWRNTDNHNLYFEGESVIPPSGSWFSASYIGASNGRHTIVLDGNEGTYRYTSNSKTYNVNRQVVASGVSNGETVNYACNFTRPGYTLVSYNSEPDGSGTEYALNKCTVTADMEPLQILYAQWKEVSADEPYISIDGVRYDASQNCSGTGWDFYYWGGQPNAYYELFLNGYSGGSIESNVALRVTCSKGQNTISGSISAPNLTINVQEGSLSVTSAEGSALHVTGELNISCNGEGTFEASGDPTALSYCELIKDGYQTYLIRSGEDKEHAEQITNDTFNDLRYISYERRDRVLTLHGNGGMTADGKYIYTVSSKDSIIDLTAYAETFTNGDKRLLGWSRQADASTIDYAAASDVSYSFDYWYGFEGDIYAVWEDDNQKGITLNDYGSFVSSDMSAHDNYCYYQTYTKAAATNTKYTLPDSYKAGYQFLGWRSAQNGKLYSAGTEVVVDQSKSYTAEYEVLTINIDGKSYGMDKPHGSQGIGWTYEPAASGNRYRSSEVTLYVYENYSGKPISIPSDVRLWLRGNVTGESSQPAIYVDGDASVAIYNGGSGRISGGANAPALKVAGTLSVDNLIYGPRPDSNRTVVEFEGGNKQSAIDAERIRIPAAFYAGNDLSSAQLVGSYNSESYLRLEAPLTATVEPGETLPECPDTDAGRFVAWGKGNDYRWTEYALPGDVNDGVSSKRYDAMFIRLWEGAVILNGNGGITNDAQKYYVVNSSGSDLELTAETATNAFHRDGYVLDGYNTNKNGTGTSYTAQELAAQVSGDGTVVGKVLTFFAQWTKSDEPVTPEKPATTPDGSTDYTISGSTVTIENVDVDKLVTDSGEKKTAEIDLSDAKSGITDVTLPTDAVKKVAASDAENLTVKLPDVTVSFDDKALAAVADQSSGANLSLSVNMGGRDSLNSAQSNAVAEARELSVIEVSLSSNGEKISNFNGGSVTIDVPFQWSMRGLLRAYYIDENGNKSAIDVTYKNGVASLVLKHFSTYVVEATDLPEPFVSILPDSVTVDAVADVTNYVAAIYNADGKLLSVSTGKADTNSETVTIRCSTDPLTEQRTLKVFFLGEGDKPVRNAAVFNMAK